MCRLGCFWFLETKHMGFARRFSHNSPVYFVSIFFLRGAPQVGSAGTKKRQMANSCTGSPCICTRTLISIKIFRYNHQITAIRASPQRNPLRSTCFGGRNWNEARKKHLKSRCFISTWETETCSPHARPVSWETKQSHRALFLVSCSLGCTRETMPEKSLFRFFQFFVFQLLP